MTRVDTVIWAFLCAMLSGPTQFACLADQQASGPEAQPDILVADFEGEDYGGWKAQGDAFGTRPARGTLPRQMPVTGFKGRGLVNSYRNGDRSTGTLTSPPFVIQRRYLNFLIGGGGYPGKTCMNLIVNGKIVRTATGPNTRPGGSEALDWQTWDVSEFIGQSAVLQIVDQATGSWGHINVDHIVQSNRRLARQTLSRTLFISKPHLHIPVRSGAPKHFVRFFLEGQLVREFEAELVGSDPQLWMDADVSEFVGRTLRIEAERMPPGSQALQRLRLADGWPGGDLLYHEPLRPQFHFTPATGWTNDPNGLVYYDGEYHLFFQHNPYGTKWGNMTWGHAVSPDLIHWRQLPDAIHPDRLGMIFSGSAVVDQQNTTGWRRGRHAPIVCIYTSAGGRTPWSADQPFTQSVAYSTDRGRSWTKYEGNPVLQNVQGRNRDPKVFWHEPSRQWVMILYLGQRGEFALFGSKNLKSWYKLSDLSFPGGHECPDLFQLPVDGDPDNTRWVAWEAGGRYLIGQFDGKTFVTESGPHRSIFGRNDYAAQTYNNIPCSDGRRIQIAWMRGGRYPDMPFNQQMTVPRVLSLRSTPDGIRLFFEPVEELKALRQKQYSWSRLKLASTSRRLDNVRGQLFDIDMRVAVGSASSVGLDIRGQKIEYSVREQQLTSLGSRAPLRLPDGRLSLRILVDRTSIEVFANGGRVQMANCFLPSAEDTGISIFAKEGTATVESLKVWQLKSIWP